LVGIIIFGNHEIYNFWLVGGASSLNWWPYWFLIISFDH